MSQNRYIKFCQTEHFLWNKTGKPNFLYDSLANILFLDVISLRLITLQKEKYFLSQLI